MENIGSKLLEIAKKHMDYKGALKEIYGDVVKPMVREFVAKTDNKLDDAVVEFALSFGDRFIDQIK